MTPLTPRMAAVAAAALLVVGLVSAAPTAVGAAAPVPDAESSGAVDVDSGGLWADGRDAGGQEYTTYGTKWRYDEITYGFVNHTGDLSVAAQEAAVASALARWASVTPLTFTPVADCGLGFDAPGCTQPDLRVSFVTGNHGGGAADPSFDGPGGTAAHAFFPPPNGASAAGDLHLDDGERWTTSGSGTDLESVTLHEMGHALGLRHPAASLCPGSASQGRPTMCGVIIGVDRSLAPDDIAGIQSLYGLPAVACDGRAVTVDLNEGQKPTSGDDVILGTPRGDRIFARTGSDTVCGGGGHDLIDLGGGSDRAVGGSGNDVIKGRSGHDRLTGGPGNDRLYAGDNNDRIYGGPGRDVLDGGRHADRLYAGPQRDMCHGRGGRDRATGCERQVSVELRIR